MSDLIRVLVNPPPLININQKLIVFWSAKSGSTFITKWFFYQADIKVTGQHSIGIQDYRSNVYYNSDLYKRGVKEYQNNPKEFNHIKFVRNPYDRAVSSYLHFLRKANLNHSIAKELLGVDKIPRRFRFSFRQFLGLLKDVDIKSCNIHWRSQVHPLERSGLIKTKIIRLKESIAEIPKIEEVFNLKESGKTRLANYKNRKHHSNKADKDYPNFIGNRRYNWDTIKDSPSSDLFYNISLRREVFRLYKEDFTFYNFEKI